VPASSSRASTPTPPTGEYGSKSHASPGSPGGASNFSDPAPLSRNNPPKSKAWKQKPIQVQSADDYLHALKAARGLDGGGGGGRKGEGYGQQMRQRAADVQAAQRREEGAREERGYAVLQRVQNRALQVSSSRSASCEV